MSRPSVLIYIDQATRDGLSQLLVAKYLWRKGVRTLVCNQATFKSMALRHRPGVMFVSWFVTPSVVDFLRSVRHRTQIFLVDQEGGRMGEASFKRSMERDGGIKLKLAQSASRVVAWGEAQRSWLEDVGIPKDRIVVTGCARLDPYLLPPEASPTGTKYLGVTLRADMLTTAPRRLIEYVYNYRKPSQKDGLRPALPVSAQFEDWVWEVVAVLRHQLRVVEELSRAADVPVMLRPGPWEQISSYAFLRGLFPKLEVRDDLLQHEYVRGAFATLDASSALGLESLLAGAPVVSVNSMIERLDDHVGGKDGARLNAPYRTFYWQPRSIEEAVDMLLAAREGQLLLTPAAEEMKTYLRDCHGWPSHRPASFRTGDVILELLGLPDGTRLAPDETVEIPPHDVWKRRTYRLVPGSHHIPNAKTLWRYWRRGEAALLGRYIYFGGLYRHHAEVTRVFEGLWRTFEASRRPGVADPDVAQDQGRAVAGAPLS